MVSSLGCPLGWPPDVFGYLPLWEKVQRQTICSDSIQARGEKYLLWKARTSEGKRVRSSIFSLFSFFNSPFLCWHVPYIFYCATSDLPTTFFCFCNTCLFVTFRTSLGVAGSNIILLYSGCMASKSICYSTFKIHTV